MNGGIWTTLAQHVVNEAVVNAATQRAAARNSALVWLAVLLGITIIGGIVGMYLRHRLLKGDDASEPIGFSLSDLRTLRDRGELSTLEYEAAVKKITDRARESLKDVSLRPKKPGSGGSSPS